MTHGAPFVIQQRRALAHLQEAVHMLFSAVLPPFHLFLHDPHGEAFGSINVTFSAVRHR